MLSVTAEDRYPPVDTLITLAKNRRLHRPAALAPLLAMTLTAGACTATMPAVTMRVVDEATGTPMPGAVAMFWGTAREGTMTGHGGRNALLFAADAIADASGQLRFPAQTFGTQPFFLNTNYENPEVLLLKPGYAPLFLHNQRSIIPTLADASQWEQDGQIVKMKKATGEEIRQQAYLIRLDTDQMLGFAGLCTWKRVPNALVMADRMFPDPGSTLRTLFMNDALFVQQGCGSPTAFFEPYSRR